jgi:hypothetical protein
MNTNKQKQSFLKTDNEVKIELNKKKSISTNTINDNLRFDNLRSDDQKFANQIEIPRYGTTVDLKTNKQTEIIDRHKTRNQNMTDQITKYKKSRINIDSRYREIDPKNIISRYYNVDYPFSFIANSNIMKINMEPNHNIRMDDNITIMNVEAKNITLKAQSLQLKKNTKYIYINHDDHGFIGADNYIEISGVRNSDPYDYYFSNVPISIINGIHKVILIYSNGVIDYNNYMVELDIFSDINYVYTEDSFNINVLTLNGIDIKHINAGYPITNNVLQGFHNVIESGYNYICVRLKEIATATLDNVGNSNIMIGLISSTIDGYPDPEFYKFKLKKTYNKVRKIRLVSTEIPNTEMLVKSNPPNLKNNSFYWNILDDGDTLYQIELDPGNYTAESLAEELKSKIDSTPRVFGNYLDSDTYYENCISKIIINPYSNLFSIQLLSKHLTSRNMSLSTETFPDKHKRLKITHLYHNLNVGDQITISNAIGVFDHTDTTGLKYFVPNHIINSLHTIETIDGINNYTIKLHKYNAVLDASILDTTTNGGEAVEILYPLSFRLLFNFKDTIGSILGYKNTGEESSITLYLKTITNRDMYQNGSNLNSVGLENLNTPTLNFNTYPYILMVSEIFSPTVNYKDSTGVFAKLFLTGNPGSLIYDQYVQITETLPSSVSYLNEFEFKFITPDGQTYNFNGQNHSYTLEIYEEFE